MGCKIDDRSNVKSIQRVKLEGPGISSMSPERKQEAQLLLGDRATRKHAKDS